MLSKEDNELITRVGPGTPMGELLRQYWIPALISEEVPEPDGAPYRVRLLVKDPEWMFAYWDLSPRAVDSLRRELGERGMALTRLTLLISDPGQGGTSVIEPQTYLYYIKLKQSRPSEGVWVPYDDSTEKQIEETVSAARGFLDQAEVAAHAGAAIEQHDHGDRLDLVGEERQVLAPAVVVDLELLAGQVRHQPAARVGHRRIDGDGPVGAAERGRLLLRRQRRSETDQAQSPERDALHRGLILRGRDPRQPRN